MNKNEALKIRCDRFQKLIADNDLGALLFVLPNRDGFDLYFTGESAKTVAPYDHPLQSMDTCILIKKGDKPTIIHASYLTAPGDPDPLLTHMGPVQMDNDMYRWCLNQKAELYIDALKDNARLGVVNLGDLREELYQHILKYVPETEFIDVTEQAHILKAKKCEYDIEQEEEAVRRLESLFYGTYAFIHPGKLERDIVDDILAAGEELAHFSNIYSDWVNVDLVSQKQDGSADKKPFLFPGRMVNMGDRLNISVIAALNGVYSAGLGRCFVLGEPSAKTHKYWDETVKIQDAAVAMLRPGSTIAKAVKCAEKRAEEDGFVIEKGNWIFGLGFNFTMAEFPMAVPGWSDKPLEEGMILCVAPRIDAEGCEPFCCMDTFVITENGAKRLTGFRREIIDLFNTGI
ncbi:MAG: aminopeptidase P family protein [Clostridia bacterium]|nr:aminopeptidase P family protein [Clostridia bacterium]